MNWSKRIRQTHRWLSAFFTLLIIVNVVVNLIPAVQEGVALGLGYFTLLPLFLLLLTGLYLFVLPYTTKGRNKQTQTE